MTFRSSPGLMSGCTQALEALVSAPTEEDREEAAEESVPADAQEAGVETVVSAEEAEVSLAQGVEAVEEEAEAEEEAERESAPLPEGSAAAEAEASVGEPITEASSPAEEQIEEPAVPAEGIPAESSGPVAEIEEPAVEPQLKTAVRQASDSSEAADGGIRATVVEALDAQAPGLIRTSSRQSSIVQRFLEAASRNCQ